MKSVINWKNLSVILIGLLAFPALSIAQQPGDSKQAKRDLQRDAANIFRLLANKTVQKELELSQEQSDELVALGKTYDQEVQDLYQVVRNLPHDQDLEKRREKIAEIQREITEAAHDLKNQVGKILLPNQMKRLDQVRNQLRFASVSKAGKSFSLLNPEVLDRLEVSELQQVKLLRKAKELRADMERKLKKMQEEAELKLFEELTKQQQKQFQELVGKPFAY